MPTSTYQKYFFKKIKKTTHMAIGPHVIFKTWSIANASPRDRQRYSSCYHAKKRLGKKVDMIQFKCLHTYLHGLICLDRLSEPVFDSTTNYIYICAVKIRVYWYINMQILWMHLEPSECNRKPHLHLHLHLHLISAAQFRTGPAVWKTR